MGSNNDLDKTSYLNTPSTFPFVAWSIPECLDNQAAAFPDKEAYVCRATGSPRQTITFKELKDQSEHLASSLIKLGLKAGSKVILSGISSIDWIVAEMAILKAGLISVRLSMTLNQSSMEAISRIINYNNAVAMMYYPGDHGEHQDFLIRMFPEFKAAGVAGKVTSERLPTLSHFISIKRQPNERYQTAGNLLQLPMDQVMFRGRQNQIECDNVATVTYTAGSEAKPKAVPHTHFMWVNFYLRSFGEMMESQNDRFYNDRSMSWFDSFVHLPIITGATLVYVRSETTVVKQHAALQYRSIVEEKCNCGLFLPYFLPDLVETREKTMGKKADPLCWGLIWGEVVQRDTLVKASSFFRRFEIAYGSTETMLATHQRWADNGEIKLGCVGQPISGIEVKVINNGGQKLPKGGYGQICVRSPFAFNIYHGSPDGMTKGIDGWISTGDYGYTARDNTLVVLSRMSNLIQRPIAICVPAVVEEVLLKHADIEKVAVFAVDSDRQNIDDVCACVVRKDGSALNEVDFINFCNDPKYSLLSPEVIPKTILFSGSFPNMDGKVDKKTLKVWAMSKLKNKMKQAQK